MIRISQYKDEYSGLTLIPWGILRTPQREPEQRLELGERAVGVPDTDRRHPERPGGLQVAAEVVEEGRGARRDAEPLEQVGIDARIGLAQADRARLDEDVEAHAQALRRVAAPDPVVGEGGGAQPALADPRHRGEHRGPRLRALRDP